MKQTVDNCVNCTSMGLHCIGSSCRNSSREVTICDDCRTRYATVNIDGDNYCDDCANNYLNEVFSNLNLKYKIEILDDAIELTDVD